MFTTGQGEIVDFAALARVATAPGAIWTQQSEDLDVNLLVFSAGDGVAEHVNTEVDVLLVGIAGTGAVTIDGTRQILSAGQALVSQRARTAASRVRANPSPTSPVIAAVAVSGHAAEFSRLHRDGGAHPAAPPRG